MHMCVWGGQCSCTCVYGEGKCSCMCVYGEGSARACVCMGRAMLVHVCVGGGDVIITCVCVYVKVRDEPKILFPLLSETGSLAGLKLVD